MTKKQAIEILHGATNLTWEACEEYGGALDRAGFFMSEETAAAIAAAVCAVETFRVEEVADSAWKRRALRLASACRAAGLVKP